MSVPEGRLKTGQRCVSVVPPARDAPLRSPPVNWRAIFVGPSGTTGRWRDIGLCEHVAFLCWTVRGRDAPAPAGETPALRFRLPVLARRVRGIPG